MWMIFYPCQNIEIQDKVKISQDDFEDLELVRSIDFITFLSEKVINSRSFLI